MNFVLYLLILLIILTIMDYKSVKSVAIFLLIIAFCIIMHIDYINYIDEMVLDGNMLVSTLLVINVLWALIKIVLFVFNYNKASKNKNDK